MFLVGYLGVRYFVKLLSIPKAIMVPLIVTFSVIGAYAIDGRVFDIWVMAILGLIGYVMKRNGMPVAPAVLAMILGPIGENAFIQSTSIFKGNYWLFFTRPICLVLMFITAASVFMTFRASRKARLAEREKA